MAFIEPLPLRNTNAVTKKLIGMAKSNKSKSILLVRVKDMVATSNGPKTIKTMSSPRA